MAAEPSLRVIVDGDSARVYRRGERVTGRVILGVEQQDGIRSLKLVFTGVCTTKTTRPFYVAGNDADAAQPRRAYEKKISLFRFEQELLPKCTLAPKKYSQSFVFKFPELTTPKYSRWTHGSKYPRRPHPLPPTFQQFTNTPGGEAEVAYYLEATLVRSRLRANVKTRHSLLYQPTPTIIPSEPRLLARVLYAQKWKPTKENRTAVDKAFTKMSRRPSATDNNICIVPTLHCPDKIAPGQHIPVLLSLTNTHRQSRTGDTEDVRCALDSVTVSISTYTTSICGQPMSQPEDVVSKHITCLSKTQLDTGIPFDTPTRLTNNFRLIDNAECVPSFKTYTITRRYTLNVTAGIKIGDLRFTIHSTTSLEILPRIPRDVLPPLPEEYEHVEPLPLYVPQEPLKEPAPSYEALYGLSRAPSSSGSFAYTESRSLSVASGMSTSSVGAWTPASEREYLDLSELPMRSR